MRKSTELGMSFCSSKTRIVSVHVADIYLARTKQNMAPNEDMVKMFESRISATANVKKQGWEKPHAKTVAWSYDMEKNVEMCIEMYCELANKKAEHLHTVSTPCLDDHNFQVGELADVCSQIVLKWLNLVRIGRPDILWSVNKLARPVKWTRAC